jgi:hypothetical protein
LEVGDGCGAHGELVEERAELSVVLGASDLAVHVGALKELNGLDDGVEVLFLLEKGLLLRRKSY